MFSWCLWERVLTLLPTSRKPPSVPRGFCCAAAYYHMQWILRLDLGRDELHKEPASLLGFTEAIWGAPLSCPSLPECGEPCKLNPPLSRIKNRLSAFNMDLNTLDLRTFFFSVSANTDHCLQITLGSVPVGVSTLGSHSLSPHHCPQATRLRSMLTCCGILPVSQIWVPFFSATLKSS